MRTDSKQIAIIQETEDSVADSEDELFTIEHIGTVEMQQYIAYRIVSRLHVSQYQYKVKLYRYITILQLVFNKLLELWSLPK